MAEKDETCVEDFLGSVDSRCSNHDPRRKVGPQLSVIFYIVISSKNLCCVFLNAMYHMNHQREREREKNVGLLKVLGGNTYHHDDTGMCIYMCMMRVNTYGIFRRLKITYV